LISRVPSKATTTPRAASRYAFSTASRLAKERNDVTAQDPEFAFLDEDTKSPNTTIDAQQTTPVTTEHVESELPAEATPFSQGEAELLTESPSPSPSQDASIPWYLRQNSFARDQAQKPIEIPDLPPNPPPLLKTLLEYISMTAGLDDLELLDLRNLDPPPALGPKLIMIIATARSEKHLHVAADRFSRYMRREHGLRANAAGLLGRNELKIKLRRKAKRMRMLANVGGTVPEGNLDDGIRTGWICCTLSKIEAHPDDMHMPGDNVEEFVGFRDVKPGVNVVVQMFTEEKRAETDLETLWGGVLRTHKRQDQRVDDELRELEEREDDVLEAGEGERFSAVAAPPAEQSTDRDVGVTAARFVPRPQPTTGDVFPSISNADTARQLRRLHTVGFGR
jgi:ribosomal silencing factor RsfS